MLYTYQQGVQLLLADVTQEKFNIGDITTYVNEARSQVAGEGQCIRGLSVMLTAVGTQSYLFSAATSLPTGTQALLSVRMITRTVTGGAALLVPRSWEWFNTFYIATTGIAQAAPTAWAQLGQGVGGSIFLSPTPDSAIPLALDGVYIPAPLVDDIAVEALPYPWTDAVQYYAAYLALLSDPAMRAEADKMWVRYTEFIARARRISTNTVLPGQYQASGITQPAHQQRAS
jgi:hypothetical protein